MSATAQAMNDPVLMNKIRRSRVYDVAIRSALSEALGLSTRISNRVLLKREDQQPIFSFKLRGAYNRLASLTPAERKQGVICASAGNHAQGVALAAQALGSTALIVMPVTTPAIKVDAVRSLGASVELAGDDYDAACTRAHELAGERARIFIHPFDDELVIAGQGTVGMEIMEQCVPPPDVVFIPVGGGGLAAGAAAYIKHVSPRTKVIGVEPVDSPSMQAALDAGSPVTLDRVGSFADGVAVRTVGTRTFELCTRYLDGMVQVTTDQMCAAIKDIFNETRTVTEAAGAIAVAGMKRYVADQDLSDKTLVAIVSGANMNFDRLLHVAERANIGEHSEALLAVEIDECKGSFLRFCQALGARSVSEFNYRYAGTARARIFVGVGLSRGEEEKQEILDSLTEQSFRCLDLSDNDLAKNHVRHTVGGYRNDVAHERILRFEFPERAGALAQFLRSVGESWNISLFHYRNHGSDYGRVLCGIQVPPDALDQFNAHLDQLGYHYVDETANPACDLFFGDATR
ncbi:MAG: threonine ammonia-lyase, biosynthetic [Gammaproteobacteria bacterium]